MFRFFAVKDAKIVLGQMPATIETMDPVDRIIADNSPDSCQKLLILDAPELVGVGSELAGRTLVFCDDVRDYRRAKQLADPGVNVVERFTDLDADVLAGVDLVWLRLPKALGALDQYAARVANFADDFVILLGGARERHLNRSMNEVLASHFGKVNATLGRQKSRALRAVSPHGGREDWPRHRRHTDVQVGEKNIPITLWANGATFATNKIDAGTKLLIDHLGMVADADVYLDLGSGNGVLATLLAKLQPTSVVHALDSSWAACDATSATAKTAVVDVQTHWASDLSGFEDGSIDVIVTNPPFHRGQAKDSDPTLELFAGASRVLSDGGELWCVYNSHLPWKAALNERVGTTTVITQNTGYTLTRTVKN